MISYHFPVEDDKRDLSHMTAAQRIMHGLESQDSGIEDRTSPSEDEESEDDVEDTFSLNFGRPPKPEECMSDDEVCTIVYCTQPTMPHVIIIC